MDANLTLLTALSMLMDKADGYRKEPFKPFTPGKGGGGVVYRYTMA